MHVTVQRREPLIFFHKRRVSFTSSTFRFLFTHTSLYTLNAYAVLRVCWFSLLPSDTCLYQRCSQHPACHTISIRPLSNDARCLSSRLFPRARLSLSEREVALLLFCLPQQILLSQCLVTRQRPPSTRLPITRSNGHTLLPHQCHR